MKRNILYTLFALVLASSLILAACQPAEVEEPTVVPVEPTQPGAVQEPTEPVQEPTSPPEGEEPTEAAPPTEETMAPEEPTTLWTRELRQAMAAAIDREVIVDRVFEGRNEPAYHMVPPGYPFATEPFLDMYGVRDLDMARDLLTQAGYSEENPFTFTLWYPPEHYGTTTADVMQVIKEQLEETGMIVVNLQTQNWAEYITASSAGEYPTFMLGWFPDFVDPDTWISPFATCVASPDLGVNYCNPEMDELIYAAAQAEDEMEREALYQELGELWAEDIPVLPLFWEPEFITYRDYVQGVAIGAPFEFNYNVLSYTDDAAPASGEMDTIIIGTTDVVNSLDPNDAYATHDWEILKNTGAPLLTYEPGTAELIPAAAVDMPEVSEDGTTYTFILQEGMMYADGTPVQAQDFVYSWERIQSLNGDVSGLVQTYVQNVEAPDERTVVYTLTGPYAFFPALAATAPFVPAKPDLFPEDELLQYPDTLGLNGPYQMVSHEPGQQMVLEVNPNYFGETPAINTVIIRYFADPTTMSNAIETGEIDIAWRTLGPVEATRLMELGTGGLTVERIDAPSLRYIVFNHEFPREN